MRSWARLQSWVIDIRNVYTVGQLNSYIKNMFRQDYLLQSLLVKGEVSNCKYHSSGHIYFTLKDPKGTISCVMFAGSRSGLSFRMSEGQQVIVAGMVDVYERDGKYQLYARQILQDGNGLLYERFEQLKRELEPPPRPTIITSTPNRSKARMPFTILGAAASPWTIAG